MSAIVFRTVYGGPDPGLVEAVTTIKREFRGIDLLYELDILLHVGGEVSSTTGPSGLHAPRVSVAKRRMTGQIRVNRHDVREAEDPDRFLRQTIHRAVREMIERIAAKDATVDAAAELRKIVSPGEA